MVFKAEYLPGSSPLDHDELQGLIPDHISSQSQLNVLEQQNIFSAQRWAGMTSRQLLDESFAKRLHQKMFGEVWRWAGVYRKTSRVLGCAPESIANQMQTLLLETKSWIESGTYTWPQILSLFHYYIVFIQPFPNGNGRFARLYTECLARQYGQKIPTWGELKFGGDLHVNNLARAEYISALRRADDKKIRSLVDFLYS